MSDLKDALIKPEVYFYPDGKCYFTRDSSGEFMSVNEAAVKRELRSMGLCPDALSGQMLSEVDAEILRIQKECNVHYAGPLAGHKVGALASENRRVLVTENPRFIEPGDGTVGWPTFQKLLRGLFVPNIEHDELVPQEIEGQMVMQPLVGEVQLHTFYSWMKVAITALRAGKRRPGQVLIIAGPAGCGKSFLQNFITMLLGGRSAKPYQYMTGATQFNAELFQAEHLMIEDEAASFDLRVRRSMGANLKGMVVNETQRAHPKNRTALTLKPFWRISITLNDEPESLMVLPPLDESLQDKMIMLRAHKVDMPMPTETLEQWGAFMSVLTSELPHFVHFLLNEWQIPARMKSDRYGVQHYHHPELLNAMSVLAPETRLLELIDSKFFPKDGIWTTWEGKASELEAELCDKNSSVAHEARKLLLYNNSCGQYLKRLFNLHPDRVEEPRTLHGYTIWKIRPPKRVEV